jgi:hypothetical protein
MSKKTKKKNGYEVIAEMFEKIQKKHPRSFVAFDVSTGRIIARSSNWKKFNKSFRESQKKSRTVSPGLVFKTI